MAVPDFSELMIEQGGFSKFQILWTLLISASTNTCGYIIYQFGYLLLYPQLECMDTHNNKVVTGENCQPYYFCNPKNNITITLLENDELTLGNWVKDFDLLCASPFTISSFAMAFFAGWALGSFWVPQQSDVFGRKRPFMFCLAIQFMVFTSLAFVPYHNEKSVFKLQVLMLILGLAASGREPIGLCYQAEFQPVSHQGYVSTFWNCTEGAIYIYLTIYYKYFNKDWYPTLIFALSLNGLVLLILVFMPESPKFLYDQKRYSECARVLKLMAKVNHGSNAKTSKIDALAEREYNHKIHETDMSEAEDIKSEDE